MRPYGERPKRRPGGDCNPAFKTFREQQRRREHCHLCRLQSYPQHRETQRGQARATGEAEIREQVEASEAGWDGDDLAHDADMRDGLMVSGAVIARCVCADIPEDARPCLPCAMIGAE